MTRPGKVMVARLESGETHEVSDHHAMTWATTFARLMNTNRTGWELDEEAGVVYYAEAYTPTSERVA